MTHSTRERLQLRDCYGVPLTPIDVDPTLHSTLRRLHLDNNRLEDEGARRLAHSLRRNRTLRIVSLHGNHHIGSRGAAALHAASRSRPVRALSAVDGRVDGR